MLTTHLTNAGHESSKKNLTIEHEPRSNQRSQLYETKKSFKVYIYEVLEDNRIFEEVRKTMLQSAAILQALYPEEFTASQLEIHIEDLLRRFKNKSLGDTIFRVGCDLYRKLDPEDRLVSPIYAAIKTGKPYHLIVNVIKAAIGFKARDANDNYFPADMQFFEEAKKGCRHILENLCKLPVDIINSTFTHADSPLCEIQSGINKKRPV